MKLRLLLLTIILFCFYSGSSQNIDSLQKILRTDIEDSLKIEMNQQIGRIYYNSSVYDSAFIFYSEAYTLAVETNNVYKISETLMQKGNVKYWISAYNEADTLFEEAVSYSKNLNDSNLNAKLFNSMGLNKMKLNDTTEAIRFLKFAFKNCTKDNLIMKGNIYANLGQIERDKLNLSKSIRYFRLSEEIWKKLGKENKIGRIKFEIGKIYFLQKKYIESIKSIHSSLNIDSINQNKTIRAWKYRRLADAYSSLEKYDSAYFYINLHHKKHEEIYDKNIEIQIKQIEIDYKEKLKKEESKLLKEKSRNQKQTIKQNQILLFIIFSILIVILLFVFLLLNGRRKFKNTNFLLEKKNAEIQAQKENLERLNHQMFESNLKIDKQNIEVIHKNKEIKLQSDKLTEKKIDLLVLNREIRKTAKLREGLTNMIVHDLKNPISSIINLTENKEITYFAKEILTMVENILDVQKYEGIMMPLNIRDYSLKDITDSAIKQIEVFAEHKNIKIENKVLKKHFIKVDEDIIRRVFVNLLSNAIKFTPANGFINIDFEIISKEIDSILIKVTDSGIGIRKDKINIIFNKFKQVMAKKTGMARSTGLGLTFCKMAIEAHDSEIVVASVPGKFTTFSFPFKLSEKTNYNNKKENKIAFELNTKLNKDDKLYLNEFFEELKELDVYEIGKLRKITIQINENSSIGIQQWKDELEKSIYNCNQELYTDIVNSIVK